MSKLAILGDKIDELYILLALARKRRRAVSAGEKGYTPNEVLVLEYLYRFPSRSQKEISRFFDFPLTSVGEIEKKLTAEGLIASDSAGQRGRKLSLTEKGAAFIPKIRKHHASCIGMIFAEKLQEVDQTSLLSVLEKLLGQKDILCDMRLATV